MKNALSCTIPLVIYPKKFARTPVNMIRGPTIAVNPAKYVTAFLIGPGKLLKNSNIFDAAFKSFVATGRKSSPISASEAFRVSIALLYFPDADSVIIPNSRSAIPARSEVLAFINSIT